MSVQSINQNECINDDLIQQLLKCRHHSIEICKNLTPEDCQIQSMEDASPIKWHLAHTTWALEVFFLKNFISDYQYFDSAYIEIFNSYYNGVGKQHIRRNRGLLSRPNLDEVIMYRKVIENTLINYLKNNTLQTNELDVFHLVIQHEKQHQELMKMDMKHGLFQNLRMCDKHRTIQNPAPLALQTQFIKFSPELTDIGTNQSEACASKQEYQFSFDNECPKHKVFLAPFQIADRLVTNSEYLEFIKGNGYQDSSNWLSQGWDYVQQNQLSCPIYWIKEDTNWFEYTENGIEPLDLNKPVSHISYFEASAFAAWKKMRLPTEFEWEVASKSDKCNQMLNHFWQWTSSSYSPYPGFKPYSGLVNEYNGKFMSGQFVLRGGCMASPKEHIRSTYRNFFHPHQSWMFSSIRLAQDV